MLVYAFGTPLWRGESRGMAGHGSKKERRRKLEYAFGNFGLYTVTFALSHVAFGWPSLDGGSLGITRATRPAQTFLQNPERPGNGRLGAGHTLGSQAN